MFDTLKLDYESIGRAIASALPEAWRTAWVLFEPKAADVGSYVALFAAADGAHKSFRLPREAYTRFMNMWQRSPSESGAQWTSATFIVQSTGASDVEYGYDPLSDEDEIPRKRAWMRKHGIELTK